MERITITRSRLIQLIFVALLCFFAFRLYDLQVIETVDISSATLSRVSRCVRHGTGYTRMIERE